MVLWVLLTMLQPVAQASAGPNAKDVRKQDRMRSRPRENGTLVSHRFMSDWELIICNDRLGSIGFKAMHHVLMFFVGCAMTQASPAMQGNYTVGVRGSGGLEGTGIIVAKSGKQSLVLTAAHLVGEGESMIQVTLFSGPMAVSVGKARLLHRSAEADIAFLRLDMASEGMAVVKLAAARSRVGPGEPGIRSLGCDRGFPVSRAESILGKRLLTREDGSRAFFWQAKDASVPGRSGGPLLNSADELIGICRGYQAGKGYYTHIDEIHAAWKRHLPSWPIP